MIKSLKRGRLLLLASAILFVSRMAVAQQPPEGYMLDNYVRELRKLVEYSLMPQAPKAEKAPTLLAVASSDPNLARHRYVRDQTVGILTDLQSLRAANEQFQKDMNAMGKKSSQTVVSSRDYDPRRPPKPVDPFAEDRKAKEKISKPMQDKQATVKTSVERRLAALESQISTPVGQQFLLPIDSPFMVALRKNSPYAPKPGSGQRFEAISITDGGLLAYMQKADPAPPGTKEFTYTTDRTKTVFVRGYIKPVTLGEIIRIPVVPAGPGKMVTIQGNSVQEFIIHQ